MIGRAATTDWCLPDPSLHISSRHAEIKFRDGAYVLEDLSTNGTFMAGGDARLPGPHTIGQGDTFLVGRFEIAAALDDATASSMAARNAAPPPPQWKGWADGAGNNAAAPSSASGWGAEPVGSAISGTGPMSQNWAPPAAPASPTTSAASSFASPPPAPSAGSGWGAPTSPTPDPAPVASTWQSAPPPQAPASAYSSPIAATPPPPSADDVWGKIAASNVVDWARGGFGSLEAAPALAPVASSPGAAFGHAPTAPAFADTAAVAETVNAGTPVLRTAAPDAPMALSATAGGLDELLAAAGIERAGLKQGDGEILRQAGQLLRRIVAGLVVMMEARARAKSQMGAAGTSLEFDGNNPLKFARAPEQALVQLLNPPERGFMPADRAIEDSFRDLQAHQIATLKAMQGALRSTLDRFSPTAIRARADQGGLLKKILPGARDAALWAAYEREFGGVAQGSDEAFMDIFAKEFRKAYEESARIV